MVLPHTIAALATINTRRVVYAQLMITIAQLQYRLTRAWIQTKARRFCVSLRRVYVALQGGDSKTMSRPFGVALLMAGCDDRGAQVLICAILVHIMCPFLRAE